jgi:N-acetyl sugar amidotransferase
MPDTKPYLELDNKGVCSACRSHEERKQENTIDGDRRKNVFDDIVAEAKAQNAPHYDALVPVSGGKDSITQVHHLLEYDLRILAVNIDYGIKTEIGKENLQVVPDMGANLITYQPEQELHKELIRIGLEDYGDPDLMSHCLLHAQPLRVAMQFEIPLVLLGEDSATEYSGENDVVSDSEINREWFNRYAANDEATPMKLAEKYGLPEAELQQYAYPDGFDESEVTAVFASHFFEWDSRKHLEIAQSYGFQTLDEPREGDYRDYVNIDEKINRIHQYLKVLKFGYGRATDHACEDIRNGYISRSEAIELVVKHGLEPLSGEYASDFCEYLGYTESEFYDILEEYRNEDIWEQDENGNWNIPGHIGEKEVA